MVWSLALRSDDAKQDLVVYGTKFGVVFLAEGPRTASIQICFISNQTIFKMKTENRKIQRYSGLKSKGKRYNRVYLGQKATQQGIYLFTA